LCRIGGVVVAVVLVGREEGMVVAEEEEGLVVG
jgi:hypothetical protein